MKVTIQEENNAVILKVEGRIAGPMVTELDRSWQGLVPSLGSKKLLVDLRGVTFVDTTGKQLLAEIHQQTEADFIADRPLTKYYAAEAKRNIRTNSR